MMMNNLTDVLLFSAGYTLIMIAVSFYYWLRGRLYGITSTVEIFHEFEPDAVERLDKKLREKLDVEFH
jgi:hypothetical protein